MIGDSECCPLSLLSVISPSAWWKPAPECSAGRRS